MADDAASKTKMLVLSFLAMVVVGLGNKVGRGAARGGGHLGD